MREGQEGSKRNCNKDDSNKEVKNKKDGVEWKKETLLKRSDGKQSVKNRAFQFVIASFFSLPTSSHFSSESCYTMRMRIPVLL